MRRATFPGPLLLLSLLTPLLPFAAAAHTAINVSTLAELRAVAATPDATITLAPGTYWLTGPTTRPSPAPDHPIFLDLSGANTTFVFTGVTLLVDTRELRGYGRVYGHSDTVRVLQISGENSTVTGLVLTVENVAMNGADAWGAPREYTADWSTTLVEVIGDGVTLRDSTFTTRGSYPYGYGDAFGKGGRPADAEGVTNAAWIDHRKHSGIRIGRGASGVTLDGVTLHMRTFGHGIFMQDGVSNITIRDCAVLGDALADSDTVIAHPVYRQWGFATYRQPIPAGIRLSRHEDGIRNYINASHATNGWPQHVHNLTIERTRVERMRDGFATGDMTGILRVSDSASFGCEQGFTPSQFASENTFTACKGDAVNGPLVFFRRSAAGVTMEVELAGDSAPVGDWPVALIGGSGHTITLTRSSPPGLYPENVYVNVSQGWREWRHRPPSDIDVSAFGNASAASSGCTIANLTGLPLVFGKNATGNTAVSPGGVLNKGSGNTYVGPTLVPGPLVVIDTWGEHTVWSGVLVAGADLPEETTITLAAGGTLARDVSLGVLRVDAFVGDADAWLRPSITPDDFDPRRSRAWPVLVASSIVGPAPALDASVLPEADGEFALEASDTALTLTYTPAPFAAWQYEHGVPAGTPPQADGDGDGRVDWLQFALAGEPLAERGETGLAITFTRLRAELIYHVEASSDLVGWTVVATNPGVVGEPVTVADPEPAARRFLRVRVTK